jgi:hypothetical protein
LVSTDKHLISNKRYRLKKKGLDLGTAASVCLNPKSRASCIKLKFYKCKDECHFVGYSKKYKEIE